MTEWRLTRTGLRWVVFIAASAGFEAFLLLEPGSTRFQAVTNELLLSAAALTAFACSLRRSRREVGRIARGWLLLSLGCLSLGLGQAGFASRSFLAGPTTDATSPAAALIVLAIPLAGAGLVSFTGSSLTSSLVTALDGTIVALSMLFVGWALVLGAVYRDSSDLLEQATTLVYVGGSLALTALVLLLAMRWRGDGITLLLLGIAFTWTSGSNAAYGLKTVRGEYVTGDALIDIGWFTPFLLIALAAARPVPHTAAPSIGRRWLLTLSIPYVMVALVTLTAAGLLLTGRVIDPFLEISGLMILSSLMARQVLTLVAHHQLTLSLERRVEERTAAVREIDARTRSLLANSSDVIALVAQDGRFLYVSPACYPVLGFSDAELVGRQVLDIIHPEDAAPAAQVFDLALRTPHRPLTLDCRVAHRAGRWCAVEATVSLNRDDQDSASVILNIRDVSDRAALKEELRQQASYDPLTSLANRRLFHERVRHALDRASRTDEVLAVLFVDLDHFKRINDSAGHSVGDALLVQVAERLRDCLRPADTAARLGGDEFAILLEGASTEHARDVAARLVAALSRPYEVAGSPLTVTASVGISTTQESAATSEALLRDADVAMYQAKAQGRAQFATFEPHMHSQLLAQMELESDLRAAVLQNEMRMVYQPIIDLRDGAIAGVEALLRWEGREGQDIPPTLFIPLAEERGLIQAIDQWAVRTACRQVRLWQLQYPAYPHLRANVNLSALDLRQPALPAQIAEILQETGLSPQDLMIEITETAVLPDAAELLPALEALRAIGVGISLDDFGTGYSSLASLRGFPLDEIKIDQSFVENIENGAGGRRLVGAIVHMAKALDLATVAEAVETPDQLAWLRRIACGTAQGHLFSPPLESAELAATLHRGLPIVPAPRAPVSSEGSLPPGGLSVGR